MEILFTHLDFDTTLSAPCLEVESSLADLPKRQKNYPSLAQGFRSSVGNGERIPLGHGSVFFI